ncbi:hypothetical protein D1AOALGA4SA_12050 [Olavius algarvensis Delta 1 endosymbiont]|nr:hypothetical protein D1AOALGA4SA_12050 [Olavius algarvensis Delta 1 endosymbiont]
MYIAESKKSHFLKKAAWLEILIVLKLLRYTNHIRRFTTSKRHHNILCIQNIDTLYQKP